MDLENESTIENHLCPQSQNIIFTFLQVTSMTANGLVTYLIFEKLFGGTEFQNRFEKRRKHLLNLDSLEKDCF